MTKTDYVKAIADKAGFTQKDIRLVLEAQKDVAYETLKTGDEVPVMDGMKLIVKDVAERTCRNPRTGDMMVSPAHKVVKGKMLSGLKTLFAE